MGYRKGGKRGASRPTSLDGAVKTKNLAVKAPWKGRDIEPGSQKKTLPRVTESPWTETKRTHGSEERGSRCILNGLHKNKYENKREQ